MRHVLASARRLATGLAIGACLLGFAACPAPRTPKGPAPEYEDPPAPSWLAAAPGGDAGGDARGDARAEGGASPAID